MTVYTVTSLRRAKSRNERVRRSTARVLTVMSRGAALQMSYERNGRRWRLSDGTPVFDDVAKLIVADHRIIGVGDALFHGLPSQTYRFAED